jgi:hypothetical protein
VVMPKSGSKAEKVISEMQFGVWFGIRGLAKSAGLSVQEMSRFLVRARRLGLVENTRINIHAGRVSLWKRLD